MKKITTRDEFLVYALAMENEAAERYSVFADQMETTNNPDVAGLFREMERLEELHAEKISEMIGASQAPTIQPWELDWGSEDAPEAVDYSATHYLMTAHQALSLVLEAEQRAVDFFQGIADGATDMEIKQVAAEFAEEERDHVILIKKWRDKYPPPAEDWDEDMDPPNALE